MVKGVNKKVVEINNTENLYFEKAIFFVRPNMAQASSKFLTEEARNYMRSIMPYEPKCSTKTTRNARLKTVLKYALIVLVTALVAIGTYWQLTIGN